MVLRKPLRRFILNAIFFSPRMCFTTSATTRGAGDRGRAHGKFALVVDQKDAVKSHRLPGFNGQALDFQRIARANAILFASCFDN